MHHPSFLHLLQYLLLILVLQLMSTSWTGAISWWTGASADDGEFTFNGFSSNDLITMDGAASVTNGLRLTSGQAELSGHAFYTFPLNFTSAVVPSSFTVPSFSTTFVFAIIGQFDDLSSHGLAFVLSSTKEFFTTALPGQYLGLFNASNNGNSSNHVLAIELDTKFNSEFHDIDGNHIGIDINGLVSVASASTGYYGDGKFYNLSLYNREPMQVWVDYDSNHTMLNVTIAPYFLWSTKPSKPLLSAQYNLSSILPTTTVYDGFSSATGILDCKHYVLGWSFKLNGEAATLDYSALSVKTIQELMQKVPTRSYKTMLCKVLLPVVVVSILVSALLVKMHMKRRLQARKNELEWQKEYGPPSFTYKDLLAATNGFEVKKLLGRGGFGSVYKGVLPVSKQTAAIKRVSPESKQGIQEFMAEINILGHLRHRNLVQLLGYCRHKQLLLLVYDYIPNGSLDFYLHTQHHKTTDLCWAQKFHIIKGVGSGLFYLHEGWEQVIIHRDIKTSNVLLDDEMNARLGDFGLARSHDHGADAHTTRVAGTWGYIAPELARLGKATKATDIFAFGVLMMEVACARRPICVNTTNGEPLALADWVLTAWQGGSMTDAVDPRLDDYVDEEIELVLKLGLLYSHPLPNARPCMRLVMQYLQRDAPLPSDFQPNSLLIIGVGQDEMNDQRAKSCPATSITDLSNGR